MWCPQCQADVAAEAVADGRRVRCAVCGHELTAHLADQNLEAKDKPARDPRELLARWADSKLLDPLGPLLPPASVTPGADVPVGLPPKKPAPPVARMDAGHLGGGLPDGLARPPHGQHAGHSAGAGASFTEIEPQAAAHDGGFRYDEPRAMRAPHFHQAAPVREPAAQIPPAIQWVSGAGQFCAYLGVAVLTVGTSMVLYGYFGGPPEFAPNGWLVTTVGQMLLFLGVVTLVSGGMEQTTHEVARRIDALGNQLLRIERGHDGGAGRGPHLPVGPDGDPDGEPGGAVREHHLRERIAHLERELHQRR